jgi:5,10-methylenetetrahydrofolate reductase
MHEERQSRIAVINGTEQRFSGPTGSKQDNTSPLPLHAHEKEYHISLNLQANHWSSWSRWAIRSESRKKDLVRLMDRAHIAAKRIFTQPVAQPAKQASSLL